MAQRVELQFAIIVTSTGEVPLTVSLPRCCRPRQPRRFVRRFRFAEVQGRRRPVVGGSDSRGRARVVGGEARSQSDHT